MSEILPAIGEAVTPYTRFALLNSIRAYLRRGEIFTRQNMDTFGLLEWSADFAISQGAVPKTESARSKGNARQRLYRALASEGGITTPRGIVHARPRVCQWCGDHEKLQRNGITNIQAYQYLPYETHGLRVIFVCMPCHHRFESGALTTKVIFDRFPGADRFSYNGRNASQ